MQLVDMDAKKDIVSPISTKRLPEKKDGGKKGIFWVRVSFLFAFYSLMLLLFLQSVVNYLHSFGIWPRQGYEILYLLIFTSTIIGILSGIIAIFKKKNLGWLAILLNVLFCFNIIIRAVTAG